MVHTFADSFWDNDFNGTTGYDTLINRLKDGKKLCDNFSEFLRNRAKLEEDYGKNLIRLAQSAGSNEEIGTLKDSWEDIRKETENMGTIHCEFSKRLLDLTEKTSRFREKQKADRYKVDDKIKKYQKDKKAAYDNMVKAKKTYEQRCKEHDQSNETYESKATYTPKEEERLKKNLQKTKGNAEAADNSYQSSIKSLEDIRVRWICEMEDAMKLFQQFEEERVMFLRSEMWTYTNLGSVMIQAEDELYRKSRDVLVKCDVSYDIQYFINQKNTGSQKPASIKYENYYLPHTPTNSNTNSLNRNSSLPRPQQNNIYSVPDLKPQISLKQLSNSQYLSDSNAAYAVVHKDTNIHPKTHRDSAQHQPAQYLVRAEYPYTAQGREELSLKEGDVIEVIKEEDELWGIGLLRGTCGAFPLEYVKRI